MITFERQREIINHLGKNQFATVAELAKLVFSSESSVRRDIKTLEQQGLVSQIYGGVVLCEYSNSVVPIKLRDKRNSSVKDELAKKAAAYIFDGATIIMDGSSTVRRIIKYINPQHKVKIITNNCGSFSENLPENITIYCTGGLYLAKNNIFAGSSAENYIRTIYADIVFFSSQAISENGDISDASEEETSLRSVMLSRAEKKIFLCDSTKIGLKRTFTLCTKDDVDFIICEKKLPWE